MDKSLDFWNMMSYDFCELFLGDALVDPLLKSLM